MDRFHWLVSAERDPSSRGPLLALVGVILLVAVATLLILSIAQPASEGPVLADEPAWGTATDEGSVVRPPAWWSPAP